MKRKTFVSIGLAGLCACSIGCASPRHNTLIGRTLNPAEARQIVKPEVKVLPSVYSSIATKRFYFDSDYETACAIGYSINSDCIQTPEETKSRKSGECKDHSFYLSKLLTDQGIYNEVVFGQVHKSDGFIFHAWNRVYENGQRFLLDSTSKTRYLESEKPDGYYNEFCSIVPHGYSHEDLDKYLSWAQSRAELPMIRIFFNGDPNKRIIGGRVK